MDVYIIMTASITKVGGAQLYTNSKKNYLESHGYKVDVISFKTGNVMINDLVRYQEHIYDELEFLPEYYSKREQDKILNRLANIYKDVSGKIVIESHNTTLHVWGELLACRLKAKHIVYEITERSKCKKELFPFFRFKYERGEMAGIQDSSLQYYFQNLMSVPVSSRNCLTAYYTTKQVDDVPFNVNSIPKASLMCTIGMLGRLDKPFILESANQIKNYVERDAGNKYTVIIIGGQKEGRSIRNKIEYLFKDVSNVSLVFTGFLFPIPRLLLNMIDIGISSSGSVLSMAEEGVPTIAIDAHDMQPLGVYGITTDNILYRKNETIVKLSNWIEEIQKDPERYRPEIKKTDVEESDFSTHLAFIEASDMNNNYFTQFNNGTLFKQLLFRVLGKGKFKKIRARFRKVL